MEKRPEIFKPNMDFIDNNKKTFYSHVEEPSPRVEEDESSSESVQDFLNKVSGSGGYVFNRRVVIVTRDKTYDTKIAGKLGNKIVTLDNDSIDVDNIVRIYEKK